MEKKMKMKTNRWNDWIYVFILDGSMSVFFPDLSTSPFFTFSFSFCISFFFSPPLLHINDHLCSLLFIFAHLFKPSTTHNQHLMSKKATIVMDSEEELESFAGSGEEIRNDEEFERVLKWMRERNQA